MLSPSLEREQNLSPPPGQIPEYAPVYDLLFCSLKKTSTYGRELFNNIHMISHFVCFFAPFLLKTRYRKQYSDSFKFAIILSQILEKGFQKHVDVNKTRFKG